MLTVFGYAAPAPVIPRTAKPTLVVERGRRKPPVGWPCIVPRNPEITADPQFLTAWLTNLKGRLWHHNGRSNGPAELMR
ncbi:hypothetical protein, partial [Actinomadura sp. HBU206391]|uniref:hypothetical protein n=1 Tax=Actinomadura sp. HBU206391 TaxID=2731692 RepID=UPI001C9CF9F2